MSPLDEQTANDMVSAFIADLQANLKIEHTEDEHGSLQPKAMWINPLVEALQEAISDVGQPSKKTFNPNKEHFDFECAQWNLDSLIKELSEDLSYHESIRSSDDQYSDPQEWWLSPLVSKLKTAMNDISFNAYF